MTRLNTLGRKKRVLKKLLALVKFSINNARTKASKFCKISIVTEYLVVKAKDLIKYLSDNKSK